MVKKEQHIHSRVIVRAKVDGRGSINPFGVFGKKEKGINVFIHDKPYKVSSDGRVNIPKSVMEQGIKGTDGRYRIQIEFSTKMGRTEDLKEVFTRTFRPCSETKDKDTGYIVKEYADEEKIYKPSYEREVNWSPIK